MNDHEAANVFGVLKAGWPDKQLPDETIELWLEMATDLHYTDAKQAALQIVREDHWFPSIARFRQATEAHAHRRRNHEAERRGIPTDNRRTGPPRELLDATRQLLTARRTMPPHNHHGPQPCPVCSGIAPKTTTPEDR